MHSKTSSNCNWNPTHQFRKNITFENPKMKLYFFLKNYPSSLMRLANTKTNCFVYCFSFNSAADKCSRFLPSPYPESG